MIAVLRHPGAAPRYPVLFEPTTMTALVVAATVASTAVTAYSMYSQGQQEKAADQYNQEVANENAQEAEQAAQVGAEQAEQQKKELTGEQLAAAAASGVDPSQGSPLDVMAYTATQGELNKQLTLWQGQTQTASYINQGTLQGFYGKSAAEAGMLNAGGTLLSGAGQVAKQYAPAPPASKPSY